MDWELFWTAFGAIGGTLGAIATTAAVIVALWQTKYANKKRLKVEFSDNIVVVPSHGDLYRRNTSMLESLLQISATGESKFVIGKSGFRMDMVR